MFSLVRGITPRCNLSRQMFQVRSLATACGLTHNKVHNVTIAHMRASSPQMFASVRGFSSEVPKKADEGKIDSVSPPYYDKSELGQPAMKKDGEKKMGVRDYFQKYGKRFVVAYLSAYIIVLFSLFGGLVVSGYDAQKIIDYCKTFSFLNGRTLHYLEGKCKEYPQLATFFAAWCMAKFTEPLRLGAVVLYLAKFTPKTPVTTAAMLPLLFTIDQVTSINEKK